MFQNKDGSDIPTKNLSKFETRVGTRILTPKIEPSKNIFFVFIELAKDIPKFLI